MSSSQPQRNVGGMFAKPAATKSETKAAAGASPHVTTHLPKKPATVAPHAVTTATTAGASADGPGTGNTSVSLPPTVFKAVRARAVEEGISNTELLVNAFSEVPASKLQRALGSDASSKGGGMPMPTTRRRRYGGGSSQMQLRLTGEQLSWLDEMKATVGAPNRSVLVATVYALYLKVRIPGA